MADVDSIRVSGTTDGNPARINDLTIDLIPNKYANFSTYVDLDSESENEEGDEDSPSLTAAEAKCQQLALERKKVEERKSLADQELQYLQQYTNTMSNLTSDKPDPATMKSALELYAAQRKAHFETITECKEQLDKLSKEFQKATKELMKEHTRDERATRAKVEAMERKKIEKEEKLREKQESKPETSTKVHRVRIIIDLPEAGGVDDAKPSDGFREANFQLTYTTSSASWTPHYDIRLDTTHPPLSTLTYRGHFTNRTFETWTNACITLSTSQASFGGLNEKIPKMESWRVNVLKRDHHMVRQSGENGLYSLAEQEITQGQRHQLQVEQQYQGTALKDMGLSGKSITRSAHSGALKSKRRFGLGGSSRLTSESEAVWSAFSAPADTIIPKEEYSAETDGATIAPAGNFVTHSTAGLDTYGLTTTYDLPTPRTIPSSPLVRRHVIAEVPLPSLLFTHILIPKLKPAAFLKVKLTNTSDIPLLSGLAGSTLDGSFLGNLSFPRASPEETVVLELGVDQGLKVEYDRPMVLHSARGMIGFGKEEIGSYKRMMRLTNTKATNVSIVVLDQVPVPVNEKLKVEILVPKGLVKEDDVVKNGVGVDGKPKKKSPKAVERSASVMKGASSSKLDDIPENGSIRAKRDTVSGNTPCRSIVDPGSTTSHWLMSATASWGTAKATLRKNGEVRWDVDLVKGGCVALALEWECKMPVGDGVQALS